MTNAHNANTALEKLPLDWDGHAWNLLTHYGDDTVASPRKTKIATFLTCEQALHLREIERSHMQVARERRRERSFALSLATANGEVAPRP